MSNLPPPEEFSRVAPFHLKLRVRALLVNITNLNKGCLEFLNLIKFNYEENDVHIIALMKKEMPQLLKYVPGQDTFTFFKDFSAMLDNKKSHSSPIISSLSQHHGRQDRIAYK